MDDSHWKFSIDNWHKLTKNSADFLLRQAEHYLNDSVDSAKLISEKTNKILAFILPVTIALIVFAVNHFIKGEVLNSFLFISSLICILILLISIYFCFKNFTSYKVYVVGDNPRKIATSEFIDNDFTENEQYINYIINALENIQYRIDCNRKNNEIKANYNNMAIKNLFFLLFVPLVAPLVNYMVTFFSYLYFSMLHYF